MNCRCMHSVIAMSSSHDLFFVETDLLRNEELTTNSSIYNERRHRSFKRIQIHIKNCLY